MESMFDLIVLDCNENQNLKKTLKKKLGLVTQIDVLITGLCFGEEMRHCSIFALS